METELIFRSSDRKKITRSSCTKMQPGISSFQLRKMEWLIGHLNGKQEHLLYSRAPKKKVIKNTMCCYVKKLFSTIFSPSSWRETSSWREKQISFR